MATGTMSRDCGWAILAAVTATLTAVSLASCLFFLVRGDFLVLLQAPFTALFGYWVAMGSWRRTSWGRPPAGAVVIGPPVLSPRRARQLITVAGGCVVALSLALALQGILGRP